MGSVYKFDAAHDAYSQITEMDKVGKVRDGTIQCIMDSSVTQTIYLLDPADQMLANV